MPFGEEIYLKLAHSAQPALNYGSTTDNIRQKFTGYQEDAETNLEFAEARMSESRYGDLLPLIHYLLRVDRQIRNRLIGMFMRLIDRSN